jgi:hypothetical protein
LVRTVVAVVAIANAAAAAHGEHVMLPFWRVARVSGTDLGCLLGHPQEDIEVLACTVTCAPIPWQLDEHDASGALALASGPEPNADVPPGVVDDNDELLWMAADSGRRMRPDELPAGAGCIQELEVRTGDAAGWAYAVVVGAAAARRSAVRYVSYDPAADIVQAGRVAIGFGAPTPRYLALRDEHGSFGQNVLDRLKVRAAARFLGLIPLGRSEDDIQWAFAAWTAGPIRVVRRESQWVRLGWGLRTPIFRTESIVYRDWIELPVRLRLNFPPTYFFRGIEVQAVLDFRDLHGWEIAAPTGAHVTVGAASKDADRQLNDTDAAWFALEGPDLMLALHLELGPSLGSLRTQLVYREDQRGAGPEDVPGEHPAVGFRLTEWGAVDRGQHWFAASAAALPPDYGLGRFIAEHDAPWSATGRPYARSSSVAISGRDGE